MLLWLQYFAFELFNGPGDVIMHISDVGTTIEVYTHSGLMTLDFADAEMMGWQWHQLDHYASHIHLAPDR